MLTKDGQPIRSMSDWEARAGPKSPTQWKDGRSAKEAARAWLGDDPTVLPKEITALLESHPGFGRPQAWTAEPEALVRFDSLRGEPSNIDVLVHFADETGDAVMVVEAKADEPFGDPVGRTLAKALSRAESNPRSRGVERVRGLAERLFGISTEDFESIEGLRYQLLTATAAALAEAQRRSVSRALVLVQEFITDLTTDSRHAENASDLNDYLVLLGVGTIESGQIVGPACYPGVDVYFGKVSVNLRAEGA